MGSSFAVKFKVGITTIIAFFFFVSGILWIKEFNPAVSKIQFSIVFHDSGGIAGGDPVTISGIKVGVISDVVLTSENKASVEVLISRNARIPVDSDFTIEEIGLMGDKALAILPGSSTSFVESSGSYEGSDSSTIGDLMSKAGEVIEKLNSISSSLENDLQIGMLTDSFQQTMLKIQTTVDEYRELAESNKEPLKQSLKNIEDTSHEMKSFIKNSDSRLNDAFDDFSRTNEQIVQSLDRLKNVSTIIDTISIYMESGESTLARLIKTEELYEELRHTNASIDSFIMDFKENPGKYTKDMQFKLRLF